MILAGLICIFVATIIFSVGVCFFKKSTPLFFVFQTFSFVSLLLLGIVCANFKNNFSGYAILLILSVVPGFLNLLDLKAYFSQRKQASEQEINALPTHESILKEKNKKKNSWFFNQFHNSQGNFISSISLLLPALAIALSGLFLGVETIYTFLLGIALASASTFLILIIKKTENFFDIMTIFFAMLSVGLLLGEIVAVAMYSFTLINIIYCVSCLVYCVYIISKIFLNDCKYFQLLYVVAMLGLFATLLI